MYQQKCNKLTQLFNVLFKVILSLCIGLSLPLVWSVSPVFAQSADSLGSITVVGEGKVTIEPDIARSNIGVEVVKETITEASAESRQLIQGILAVLEAQGIAKNDIQTSGFNIYAERYGPNGPLANDEVQYRVNNTVLIIIRDLEQVGDILDAAIEAGANNIHGVNFQIEDPSRLSSEARQSAVEDARAKAEELAGLTGVALGNVINVSEVIGGNGGYYQSNFDEASTALGGGGGGFAPGELSLVMRLQVTYAIASTNHDAMGDKESEVIEIDEPMTLFVAPETTKCVGVAPQSCLQVKSNEGDDWELIYGQIEGFDYEPGFGYELLVQKIHIENPPADSSSIRYQLVELVSQIDLTDEDMDESDDTN